MGKIIRPFAVVAGSSLAALALGSGVAFAASGPAHPATNPPAAASTAQQADGPDGTDTGANVQQGDQNAPDNTGQAEAPETATGAAAPAAKTAAVSTTLTRPGTSAKPAVQAEQAGGEQGTSDGPGGHADQGANADHQFEGNE